MADLLLRDAERIRKHERFDAKLHQDTLRAIRSLEPSRLEGWFQPKRVTVALGGLAACVMLILVLQPAPDVTPTSGIIAATAPPSAALSYRSAASEGEDALMAMLDEDARVLLPRSTDVFRSDY